MIDARGNTTGLILYRYVSYVWDQGKASLIHTRMIGMGVNAARIG